MSSCMVDGYRELWGIRESQSDKGNMLRFLADVSESQWRPPQDVGSLSVGAFSDSW